jgi:hypothetical protein
MAEKNAGQKINMIVEENVFVTVRDGTQIAVDIYRPDAPGKYPALLAMSPYGKSAQTFETPPQPFGKSVFEASVESGDPRFYVERGYAYVIGDLRGQVILKVNMLAYYHWMKEETVQMLLNGWQSSYGVTEISDWQESVILLQYSLELQQNSRPI